MKTLLLPFLLTFPALAIEPGSEFELETYYQLAAALASKPCGEVVAIELQTHVPTSHWYFLTPTGGSRYLSHPAGDPLRAGSMRYPAAEYKALVDDINRPAYFAMNAEYLPERPMEPGKQPSVTETTLRCADGTEKKVRSYNGAGPSALKGIVARIQAFANTHFFRD